MIARTPDAAPTTLLVVDARALRLPAVRAAAARLGWRVELERLDGSAAEGAPDGPAAGPWFAEMLRLRVVADDGGTVDATRLLASSPGLARDETRRLHGGG